MKTKKYTRLTAQELKLLVLAVKAKEPQAIATLCKEYEGMIKKLCTRPHIVNVLGYEEASNSCYVYLLEIVLGYKGNNWQQLPGLIYLHTRRMLHKEYLKELCHKGAFATLPEEPVIEDFATSLEMENVSFTAFVDSLPPQEQIVTKLLVYDGLTKNEVAELTGFSLRTIYNLRKKTIARLLAQ